MHQGHVSSNLRAEVRAAHLNCGERVPGNELFKSTTGENPEQSRAKVPLSEHGKDHGLCDHTVLVHRSLAELTKQPKAKILYMVLVLCKMPLLFEYLRRIQFASLPPLPWPWGRPT